MSPQNNGGPAFPHPEAILGKDGEIVLLHEYGLCQPGMSLLDYFAAHAAEDDYMAHMPATQREGDSLKKKDGFRHTFAWARYEHAADMLAEKLRREGTTE